LKDAFIDWDKLPCPDLPLMVGMDGGYVRYYDFKTKQKGNFEVMVGKCTSSDGTSKSFGFSYCYDNKPKRRILEVLKSLGMQMNQQVTFISDGDEKIRELAFCLNPNSEQIRLLVSHYNADNSHESASQRFNH